MNVRISTGAPLETRADALVLPFFSGTVLEGTAAEIDRALEGELAAVVTSGENNGKANETTLVHARGRSFNRVLLVGMGEPAKFKLQQLARYAGTAVRYLGKRNVHEVAFVLPPQASADPAAAASFIAEGAISATLDTTIYRSEPDRPVVSDSIAIVAGGADRDALERGARRGEILGEAINTARRMALTPANDMTPSHMAERARELAERFGLQFNVLDEADMREKGMGALLGVSSGSEQPAKMIVMRYDGAPESNERLALVGKGLTFDSGGISIKPAENMHEMKYDMSGGAGVIAAMSAIAQLKPKVNVIGVVPASENLPGGRAMKPGDILRAMDGKTIEVINTDAEGRLILADALCYARELGATKIVDAATLTGACVVALGHAASGVMSNEESFVTRFLEIAGDTGERYWRLPLFEDYSNAVKSDIADLRNSTGRAGGTVTAGAFLQNFVADVPWIHLDIAGTAYLDAESPFSAKGPTGTPVRAFVALAEALAASPGTTHATTNGAAKTASGVA